MRTAHVMSHLQAANPVDVAELEGWPTSPRGQEILRRVGSFPLRTERRRRHVARFVVPATSVAAVVAVATLLGPLAGTRGASPAAAEVLLAVARVAEKQPPTPVPADGYRYQKTKDAYRILYDACSIPMPGPPLTCPMPPPDDWEFSVVVPHTREVWIGSDGSGRALIRTGEPRFLGPEDRAEWVAAGRPELDQPGSSDQTFGPNELIYTDFSQYSTDPDELYDQIRSKAEGYGPSTDAEMFVLVGDMLRETGKENVAPPELRAALFRVAAMVSGVELVGEVTDPAGRKGVAVARTQDDFGYLERNELIFDPDTSELLAERQVLLERVSWIDAEPGTVIGYAAYHLKSGVVESTSERP